MPPKNKKNNPACGEDINFVISRTQVITSIVVIASSVNNECVLIADKNDPDSVIFHSKKAPITYSWSPAKPYPVEGVFVKTWENIEAVYIYGEPRPEAIFRTR